MQDLETHAIYKIYNSFKTPENEVYCQGVVGKWEMKEDVQERARVFELGDLEVFNLN